MKKSLFSVIFLFFLLTPFFLKAQLNHFIYLQTEGRQPFYAKIDKKVISSSASGYLIIPKLTNGAYTISIGFPKSDSPEQNYVCTVDNKDAGFLLKNFGDKGWGLFNLQTLEVVTSGDMEKGKEVAKIETTDAFSTMLSDVVDDPSIKQTAKLKDDTRPKDDKLTESKVETKTINEDGNPKNEPTVQHEKVVEQNLAVNTITKVRVTSDIDGVEMIYVDMVNGEKDTVRVFIPSENAVDGVTQTVIKSEVPVLQEPKSTGEPRVEVTIQADKTTPEASQETNTPVKTGNLDTSIPGAKQDIKAVNNVTAGSTKRDGLNEEKFLPIELPSPNRETEETGSKKESVATADAGKAAHPVVDQPLAQTAMINSDCNGNATEDDFLKLRKKMAGVELDDGMIAVAKKYFKTKCFTTDQVKNLSVLFLKDSGKYNFFDLAYQFVSDSHNFGTLESQLTEAYFISRFKAMIRH